MEATNTQSDDTPLPYPKGVFFITFYMFCDCLNGYCLLMNLHPYLVNALSLDTRISTVITLYMPICVYLCGIFGAILADGFIGNYQTIYCASGVYVMGTVFLVLASIPPINVTSNSFSMLGLLCITFASGALKPCFITMSADQFHLPMHTKHLTTYYAFYYFALYLGLFLALIMEFAMRSLRCFVAKRCYTLVFSVPGIIMISASIVFVAGKKYYINMKPEVNVIALIGKCIVCAIKTKSKSSEKLVHWLDYAADVYGPQLVDDIKRIFSIFLLFTPIPFFWVLFYQQLSGWTHVARQMDGDIGFHRIEPDKIQYTHIALTLLFVPCYHYGMKRCFRKLNILQAKLQRLFAGGFLAVVAFIISAFIALATEKGSIHLINADTSSLAIYNNFECKIQFKSGFYARNEKSEWIEALNFTRILYNFDFTNDLLYELNGACVQDDDEKKYGTIRLKARRDIGLLLQDKRQFVASFKDPNGFPAVRNLVHSSNSTHLYSIKYYDEHNALVLSTDSAAINKQFKLSSQTGHYKIHFNDVKLTEYYFEGGGVYGVMINVNETHTGQSKKFNVVQVLPHNSVHMLWLVIPYAIMSMGETIFFISGAEFIYRQSPLGMKTLLQAFWFLTMALGNCVAIIIESKELFHHMSFNIFVYSAIMLILLLIFVILSKRYKYVEVH